MTDGGVFVVLLVVVVVFAHETRVYTPSLPLGRILILIRTNLKKEVWLQLFSGSLIQAGHLYFGV